MDMDDYRRRKEAFVSNLPGTSLYETSLFLINSCTAYFLCQILKPSIPNHSISIFLFESFTLVIPLVLASTSLASVSYVFTIILCAIASFIYVLKSALPVHRRSPDHSSYSRIIQTYRSQLLILTCICILAVDFSVFPRRYAKTENYGYSPMDAGVGSFVLAHGVVSAEARNKQTKVKDLFLENFILLTLGLVRFISLKYFSYAEHVSEYGVHWNFFLTLCFMKLIGSCLLSMTKNVFLSIGLAIVFHEVILLRYLHFDAYLMQLNHSRTGFIDANREGIFSLGGYVCMYLIGVYIGRCVLANERDQRFQSMAVKFAIASFILCGMDVHSSRKLCNFGYITSTTGLVCASIGGYSIIQWLLWRKGYPTESALLKAINQKGMDMFLLANVLTGVINLNIDTIDTSNSMALFIIVIYMLIVTAFAYFSPSLIKLAMRHLKLAKN